MTSPAHPPAAPVSPGFAESPSVAPASPPLATAGKITGLQWLPTWIILISLSAAAASLLVLATRSSHGFFVPTLATAVCMLAALFDAFTTRIPNPLTYTAALLGIAINGMAALLGLVHGHSALTWLGAPGLTQSLLGLAVCIPLSLLALFFRVGGGDLKLMVALAALLGLSQLGYVTMIGLIVAGIYGLINLAVFGRLNSFARIIALRGLELFFLRRFSRLEVSDERLPGSQVPMAIPLAIGLIMAQVFSLQTLLSAGGGAP